MSKEHLGELEELILLIIITLEDDAYGLSIRNALKEKVKRNVTIGAVQGTVNRLESKGFITSSVGGATELRGGRSKRIFKITNEGNNMLEKARDLKFQLWQQIPSLAISTNEKS